MSKEELYVLVAFFKSDVVARLLERYNYTEDEKIKVERAVREALSSEPNLVLLRRADDIMNEKAKHQTPNFRRELSSQEKEVLTYSSTNTFSDTPSKNTSSLYIRWFMRIFIVLIMILLISEYLQSNHA